MSLIPNVKIERYQLGKTVLHSPFRILKSDLSLSLKEIFELYFVSLDYVEEDADLRFETDLKRSNEEYALDIDAFGAKISQNSISGAMYGIYTLLQLIHDDVVLFCHIEDYPDLPTRGVMIDISRNKIPKMTELKKWIQKLSFLKLNHLELYVEGFSYHVEALPNGKYDTPLTKDEFKELQQVAKKYSIDLVPNMNGLGHMTSWLEIDENRHLAEKEDGFVAWGHPFPPSTLNPLDSGSIEIVKIMFQDLINASSSSYFHMNLDEPFELGLGKSKEACAKSSKEEVYLSYVNKISEYVKSFGKVPLMWADVVINHPESYQLLPSGVVLCDWGYDYDYPFEKHAQDLSAHGVPFLLSPGTSSWNSFSSRFKDMLFTTTNACKSAKLYGGLGVLTTDWGDFGHLQYPLFSLPGFVYASALSWGSSVVEEEAKEVMNRFLLENKVNAEEIFKLSKLSSLENQYVYNGTMTFKTVMYSDPDLSHPVEQRATFLQSMLKKTPISDDSIQRIKAELNDVLKYLQGEGTLEFEEITNCIRMIEFSLDLNHCFAMDIPIPSTSHQMIQEMIDSHRNCWLERNRMGGLRLSLSRLVSLQEIIEFLSA